MKTSGLMGALACAVALCAPGAAAAAPVPVTEADVSRVSEGQTSEASWVLFTRLGTPATAGAFVDGPAAPPLGRGSFRTATADESEKVFLLNFDHVGTALADVDDISYATYRQAGTGAQLPALNVQIDFNGPGVSGGNATLVYEPAYQATAPADGTWQRWDADAGTWWSTRNIGGQCAGATAECDKTWAEVVANNPVAFVQGGVGINQGSGNPGLVAASDAFTFDESAYDFEFAVVLDEDGDGVVDEDDNCVAVPNAGQPDADGDGTGDACDPDRDGDGALDAGDNCQDLANPGQEDLDGDGAGAACDPGERPASKADCKRGGFAAFTTGFDREPAYRNQGACVRSVAHGGDGA